MSLGFVQVRLGRLGALRSSMGLSGSCGCALAATVFYQFCSRSSGSSWCVLGVAGFVQVRPVCPCALWG